MVCAGECRRSRAGKSRLGGLRRDTAHGSRKAEGSVGEPIERVRCGEAGARSEVLKHTCEIFGG